uniref:non-specific serine/threonine protein kinase n=1 Tax=Oryza meridionalis TaxID=40149 RepID=A0A0E0DMJ2_9ORYZ
MLRIFVILVSLLLSIHSPACSAATDTISAGEALLKDQKLVSRNGRFALGFFHPDTDSKFFPRHALKHCARRRR